MRCLKALRLTSRWFGGVTTPVLFKGVYIGRLDRTTILKLRGLKASQTLSNAVQSLSYRPYIRRACKYNHSWEIETLFTCVAMNDDGYYTQQALTLGEALLRRTILNALSTFRLLSSISIKYPEHSKRTINDSEVVQVPGRLLPSPAKCLD
jgi:hypothetical protein